MMSEQLVRIAGRTRIDVEFTSNVSDVEIPPLPESLHEPTRTGEAGDALVLRPSHIAQAGVVGVFPAVPFGITRLTSEKEP